MQEWETTQNGCNCALCTVDDTCCFHGFRLGPKTSVYHVKVIVVSTASGCVVTNCATTTLQGFNKHHPKEAKGKAAPYQGGGFVLLFLSLFCFTFPFFVACRGYPLTPLRASKSNFHNKNESNFNQIDVTFFTTFGFIFWSISFSMFCQFFLFFMFVSCISFIFVVFHSHVFHFFDLHECVFGLFVFFFFWAQMNYEGSTHSMINCK